MFFGTLLVCESAYCVYKPIGSYKMVKTQMRLIAVNERRKATKKVTPLR